jgi:hypothetical protein
MEHSISFIDRVKMLPIKVVIELRHFSKLKNAKCRATRLTTLITNQEQSEIYKEQLGKFLLID